MNLHAVQSRLESRTALILEWVARTFGVPGGAGVETVVPLGSTQMTVPLPRVAPGAYGVTAQPSWLTTVAVTGRAATGFTLLFGTAAPAGAHVHWITFTTDR
jgi:hypothetical protein